jgi:hypothetical protein
LATSCYRKHAGGIYTGVDPQLHFDRNIQMFKLILQNDSLPPVALLQKLINNHHLHLAYLSSHRKSTREAWTLFKKVPISQLFYYPKMWLKTVASILIRPMLETTGLINTNRH